MALLNFWIPVGLVLASRALLFASTCLVSLCISTSPFPPDTLNIQRVPTPFQQRARAVNSHATICFKSMSPFHHFSILLTLYFSSFILSTITYPVVSNATRPKAFHTLAYFISDFPIVLQVCAPILKGYIRYYTLLVVQRYPSVFKLSRRPRIISVVFPSFSTCVPSPQALTLLRFTSSSPSSTPSRIRSSR